MAARPADSLGLQLIARDDAGFPERTFLQANLWTGSPPFAVFYTAVKGSMAVGWLTGSWQAIARAFFVAAATLTSTISGEANAQTKMEMSSRPGAQPPLSLRQSARRFSKAALSGGDVDVAGFVAATHEFVSSVERFGEFTSRGANDARQNLRRVAQRTATSRLSSMRAWLRDGVARGERKVRGGPASNTPAEALLWARLSVAFWIETFKEKVRGTSSLGDASRSGFRRSMARYLDRFGCAAFWAASRQIPDWEQVRERTHLGCENGVCSDEHLVRELNAFVKEVEPVIERMTTLQKSVGLEDLRTPGV